MYSLSEVIKIGKPKDPERSWSKLWYEVTQETTFHGVRFITQKQPYTIRRMIWAVLVLGCVSGFFYITFIRLMTLLGRPKAVNVEVVYATALTYPSVTICNQNFFRGSETFQMGLYDQVDDRFSGKEIKDTGGECQEGQFDKVSGQYASLLSQPRSWSEASDIGYFASYHQVTLRVCRQVCVTYHDAECNAFIYLLANKTCLMTSLTPFIERRTGDKQLYVYNNTNLDTYARRRCPGVVSCDFESTTCPFYQSDESIQPWRRNSGPTSTPDTGPTRDHTRIYGYYLYVESPAQPGSLNPVLSSHFMDAESPLCLRFAYSLKGLTTQIGKIKVILNTVLGSSDTLWTSNGLTLKEWDLAIVHLGTGLFQVLFEAEPGSGSRGDVAIDDVTIQPCSDFVEECRRTLSGTDYFGNISVTADGSQCDQWSSRSSYSGKDFPDGHTSHSACRNPNNDPRGPWCYVGHRREYCNITMCECQDNEYRCKEGVCLHHLQVCDGIADCQNEEDEVEGCVTSVSCDFEEVNSCGYNLDPLDLIGQGKSSWLRYSGRMRNGHLRLDHTHQTKQGHYLYFDSGDILLKFGERVPVTTPVFTNSSLEDKCLSFHLYNRRDAVFPNGMGTLKLYQRFGRYQREPVAVYPGSKENNWVKKVIILHQAEREYNLTFEVTQGDTFYSDIALDDIQLEPWSSCNRVAQCGGTYLRQSYKCNGEIDCPDFYDEGDLLCGYKRTLSCTFSDPYRCGYRDESNPDDDVWTYRSEIDVEKGYISFFGVHDAPMKIDSLKRLLSPIMTSQSEGCLSYSYRINPTESYYCHMNLYQELTDTKTRLMTMGTSVIGESYKWRLAHINLPKANFSQLSFLASCAKDDDRITADITGISLSDGTCEDQFSNGDFECVFSKEVTCGFLDVSEGEVTWVTTTKGIKTGLPRVANVNQGTSCLLSPILTLADTTCIMLRVISLGGRSKITIVNYHQRTTKHYTGNLYGGRLTNIKFNLNGGSHRLLIIAELQRESVIYIQTALTGKCYFEDSILPSNSETLSRNEMEKGYASKDVVSAVKLGTATVVEALQPGDDRLTIKEPDPDLPAYYRRAGHQVKDMLYGCTWAGRQCDSANFTSSITDFGYCHTFNPGGDGFPLINTSSTGSSAGLSLLLNIEQYDYMKGPHNNAGVKVFLHASNEVPMVRDLGFAVGPGQHAFVAMTLSKSTSLARPKGTCGSQPLKYGGAYSYSACIRDCETDYVVNTCGCRDAFMPGFDIDDPPICNISTYLDCLASESAGFGEHSNGCVCTEPCERDIYESQVSYAELSSISVDQVLSSNTESLQQRYLTTLEVNQRANPDILPEDLKLLNDITKSYKQLINFAFHQAWSSPNSLFQRIDSALQWFLSSVVRDDFSTFMASTLDTYKEAFEREYGPIRDTVSGFSLRILQDIEAFSQLLDKFISDNQHPEEIYEMVVSLSLSLKVLSDTTDTYGDALSQRESVYKTGISGKSITPVELLPTIKNVESSNSDCAAKVSSMQTIIKSELPKILTPIDEDLSEYLDGSMSSEKIKAMKNDFTTRLSQIYNYHQQLKVHIPNAVACVDEYYNFLTTMSETKTTTLDSITNSIASLPLAVSTSSVDDILDYYDETDALTEHQTEIENLLLSYKERKTSKLELSEVFSDSNISDSIQKLTLFKSHVSRQLIEPARQRIIDVKAVALNIYTKALKDQLQLSLYFTNSHMHAGDFNLWRRPQAKVEEGSGVTFASDRFKIGDLKHLIDVHLYKVLSQLLDWYAKPLTTELDKFEANLIMYKKQVESSLTTMGKKAAQFEKLTVLGPDFIRNNFLALDIFFAQLKYQKTEQIEAYTGEDFFGDVGGFMGLLLGGSIMSLFEFVDLIVYNCFRKCRRTKQSSVQVVDAWVDPVEKIKL